MSDSSVGNSNTMTKDTTMSDAMTDNTTVGDAMTDTNNGSGEGSSAIVSDLGNISVDIVGVVGNVLHTAVGKGNGVGALNNTCAIVGLGGVEVGLGVVVGDGVVVGVGGDLIGVDLGDSVGNGVGNSGCHWLVGGERGSRGNNCCWSNCLVGNMLGNNWLVGGEGGGGVGKG